MIFFFIGLKSYGGGFPPPTRLTQVSFNLPHRVNERLYLFAVRRGDLCTVERVNLALVIFEEKISVNVCCAVLITRARVLVDATVF